VRISFSGWIGIGLVLALVVLAAFGKKIKEGSWGTGSLSMPGLS